MEGTQQIDPLDILELSVELSQLELGKLEIITESLQIKREKNSENNTIKQIIDKLNINNNERFKKIKKLVETLKENQKTVDSGIIKKEIKNEDTKK